MPQTVLAASIYLLNNNADIFDDPQVFRPERWLEARTRGENLHKYLASFAKGSRGCVGMKYVLLDRFTLRCEQL
jgi:cytochrome P450